MEDLYIIIVKNTANIWYKRLSHIENMPLFKLKKVSELLKIEGPLTEQHINQNCEICIAAKMTRMINKVSKNNEKGYKIFGDIWGPIKPIILFKKHYFGTFIEHESSYVTLVLLRTRKAIL